VTAPQRLIDSVLGLVKLARDAPLFSGGGELGLLQLPSQPVVLEPPPRANPIGGLSDLATGLLLVRLERRQPRSIVGADGILLCAG
jgi:hypothetical protein